MLVAGANFALNIQLFRGKPLAVWRAPEFRFYNLEDRVPRELSQRRVIFPPDAQGDENGNAPSTPR